MLCIVWSNIGWQILVLFGGLAAIDASILESAQIDGAGWWQRFFHITLPMLLRTIEYSFIMSMIYIFSGIFPLIQTITNGGPGYETTTIDYMIYIKGFTNSRYGEACALAVILLVIILLITKAQMAAANKLGDWEG
ncbi:MAG TPA: sugar ABC transporter permease [Candidatus Caccousia avistercoris]|nr:sugar ABC transporter permease [Candidatus Caccousia avistercoris]